MSNISSNAFTLIQQLLATQFHLLIFDFVELMNCLAVFLRSTHTNLALRALDQLSLSADHLSAGIIDPSIHVQRAATDALGLGWDKSGPSEEEEAGEGVFRLWWPLLQALAQVGSALNPLYIYYNVY
jgi:hypothetical protein